jgi:hypothetical protein
MVALERSFSMSNNLISKYPDSKRQSHYDLIQHLILKKKPDADKYSSDELSNR